MQGKENFYIVYDHVSARIVMSVTRPNDAVAVRDVLSTLQIPLKDNELYQIGTVEYDFQNESESVQFGFGFVYNSCPIRHVDWKSYSFPESVVDALQPLGDNVTFKE